MAAPLTNGTRSLRAAGQIQHEFERAVMQISENPTRFPEYVFATRYCQQRRFPYLLVFRETEESIQIIAVAHAHRKEGYWQNRGHTESSGK